MSKNWCQKYLQNIANVGFKSLVSRLGRGPFKSRSRFEFLLKVSVSQRQCLVSVLKILAETPALVCVQETSKNLGIHYQ